MKKVIRINTETGMYIEDVILRDTENTPIDCIESICPDGFYYPMWNGHIWVEGLTQEQIDENIYKQPKQMLTFEQMDGLLTFLFEGRND